MVFLWHLNGNLHQLSRHAARHLFACPGCRQQLSTTQLLRAGHNKWSKTKHIKAVTDKKKMTERKNFGRQITLYSKMYGHDPQFNPALANVIAAANKASVPKAVIEAAVAKSQGKSASGAKLESMTMEFLMPPDTAFIIDIETDNKIRTLQDMKAVFRKAGGTTGSTAFCFSRRGRAVLKPAPDCRATLSDLMDEAIENDGAQDIEEHLEGSYVLWTDPSSLMAIVKSFMAKFDLQLLNADIVWSPNEDTMVKLSSDEAANTLSSLLEALKEYSEIKGVFTNALQGSASDEAWETIERHIDFY